MNNPIARTDITLDKYLPTLDGWRAVAIILVLFAHSIYSIQRAFADYGVYTNLMSFAPLGLLGVHIFFVISGFLITRNMLNEEKSRGQLAIGAFYYRRLFRIIPAAFVFLTCVAFLSFLNVIDITLGEWLSALLFWANYSHAHKSWYTGHFWSLAVEEHFYIFWPFLFVLFKSNKKRAFFLLCTAVAVATWRWFAYKWWLTGDPPEYFWARTDVQVDNIIYGALAAVLIEFDRFKNFVGILTRHKSLFPVFVGSVFLIEALVHLSGSVNFVLLSFNPALIAVAMLTLIIERTGFIFWVLEIKFLKKIGIISYSTYLWQELFLNRSDYIPPKLAFVQSFPLDIVLAFSCAVLSYKFVEIPMIKLGRRLSRSGRLAQGSGSDIRQSTDNTLEDAAAELK